MADYLLTQHTTTYVSSHYYVSSYYSVCPHTTTYVSSRAGGTRCVPCYYICVLILRVCSYICVPARRRHVMRTSRTTPGRYGALPYVSSYYYICVLTRPHTTIYMSSDYYMCVLILLCAIIPLNVCPHTTICVLILLILICVLITHTGEVLSVSSYSYTCVLILLYT